MKCLKKTKHTLRTIYYYSDLTRTWSAMLPEQFAALHPGFFFFLFYQTLSLTNRLSSKGVWLSLLYSGCNLWGEKHRGFIVWILLVFITVVSFPFITTKLIITSAKQDHTTTAFKITLQHFSVILSFLLWL